MLPETIIRLSKLVNIVGVKEATGELSRVTILNAGCGDSLRFIPVMMLLLESLWEWVVTEISLSLRTLPLG